LEKVSDEGISNRLYSKESETEEGLGKDGMNTLA
jgi:hypothetical protein